MTDERRELNRRSWNAATLAHNRHKADQAGFLRDGGTTLFDTEIERLGDVAGKRALHLQCNSGQDSLCVARLGAEVTGVDLSDEAIAFARQLSRDAGIPATFEEGEIIAWLEGTAATARRFDLAFATYGAIGWIEDLGRWMQGVHDVLVPGGRFVLVEFHPLAWTIGADEKVAEPYFIDDAIEEAEGVRDYVAASGDGLAPMGVVEGATEFENPHAAVCWAWTVGEIVTHAARAGLVIESLDELPYSNGCRVRDDLVDLGDRRFGFAPGRFTTPLMLAVTARRPG